MLWKLEYVDLFQDFVTVHYALFSEYLIRDLLPSGSGKGKKRRKITQTEIQQLVLHSNVIVT